MAYQRIFLIRLFNEFNEDFEGYHDTILVNF